MSAECTWTGNSEVDAAIVMLDRIDCSPEDDSRVDAVEATLRRLHARNEELEAMLEAVGAGGVSAQRVTQSQPLKASSDWLIDGGLLHRLNDRGTNCDEINVTMAGGLRTEAARVERAGEILNMLKAVQQAEDHIEQPIEMVAAPAELNLDDYYCKGCGRIGEIEELNAQDKEKLRKIEGKPKTVAAPVCETDAQEPVAWRYQTSTGWHATTDASAALRVSKHHAIEPMYTAPQPQADARDAERYHWMRETFVDDDVVWPMDVSLAKTGEELDAAIDAAIAAAKE